MNEKIRVMAKSDSGSVGIPSLKARVSIGRKG